MGTRFKHDDDVGLERLEVDDLYLIESFTVDFAHSRVDVALWRRDGTGAAQLRFDQVMDHYIQPGRYDGDAAIEEPCRHAPWVRD